MAFLGPNQEPPIDYSNLNTPALTALDQQLVKDFHDVLDAEKMETCWNGETMRGCKERWFGMQLDKSPASATSQLCKRCRTTGDGSKAAIDPDLTSAANCMDPGAFPTINDSALESASIRIAFLPDSSADEEMLIHVYVETRSTGKLWNELPLVPENLETVLRRLAQGDDITNRIFSRDFRVRQGAVRNWLNWLENNHPGYANVLDDVVFDRITVEHYTDIPPPTRAADDALNASQLAPASTSGSDPALAEEEQETFEDYPQVSALAMALAPRDQQQQLQGVIDQWEQQQERHRAEVLIQAGQGDAGGDVQNYHTMPPFDPIPLDEFSGRHDLLSLAFPTLYPHEVADFVACRRRTVAYDDYLEHMIKYQDGHFARHPRFRHVGLNTLMRKQT
ncbi:hypothetical protein Slin15195_G129110 [Septoria linicola]|uniref:DUF6570 domain-containing protein n=1 Tax=Septoria linicola TaxID=215465 RepID=A0A9Q9B963_9PEZI|nr:hypothetical protein Slin14017_G121640 [Septoria linicola]USW59592.1 hypothetical protein Slin15195_G129110 [Septoria linicola]